jgi:DNA-3-methyladenine glycosylase II
LIIWFLSLHSPSYSFGVSPKKLSGQSSGKKADQSKATTRDPDELPAFGPQANLSSDESPTDVTLQFVDVSSAPPANVGDGTSEPGESAVASIPPAFTPSIKTTLNKPAVEPGLNLIPLPEGLSAAVLKSRLGGKKKIKYVLSLHGRDSPNENFLLQRGPFDS